MKQALIFLLFSLSLACNRAEPVVNSTRPINAADQSNEVKTAIAHSSENQTPKPANSTGGKWTQSGDPIDTSEFDQKIKQAESALRAAEAGVKERTKPPSSSEVEATREERLNLAEAYFERGFALTQARQYASAIGDYRRALKYDPDHEESKKWIDQISSIYSMLKKEGPKEGEEPPPLPFKKTA